MPETNPQFQTLTDRLDMLFSRRTAKESDYLDSLAQKMQQAIGQGMDTLNQAVNKFRGSVSEISLGGEDSSIIDSITSSIGGFEEPTAEMQSKKEGVISGLESQSEEKLGQFDKNSIQEQIDAISTQTADTIQEDLEKVNKVFEKLSTVADVSTDEVDTLKESFSGFQKKIKDIQKQAAEGEIEAGKVKSRLTTEVDKIQNNIEGTFDQLDINVAEGVSEDLNKLPGLIADQIEAGAAEANAGQQVSGLETGAATAEIANVITAGTETKGVLRGVGEQFRSIKNAIMGSTAAITAFNAAIAAILAPLGIALDLFEDTFSVARDFREETGIGTERMRELRSVTSDVSADLAEFGVGPDAIAPMQTAFVETFGSIEAAIERTGKTQEELITDTAALSQGFAMSAQEAAKLQGTLQNIESTTGLSSDQLAVATRELARQNEVAPQQAMNQISSNAEQLSIYAGDSEQRLAEAAVQAQRLGTSLESVTSFQEQALGDITGTVEQLQQASMITGQAFGSGSLIQASFEGTAETMDEIRNQLTQISSQEFENFNALQRQSLSDAFGIPSSEIASIIEGQEALEGLNTSAERAKAIASGEATVAQAITRGPANDRIDRLQDQFNSLYYLIGEQLRPVIKSLANQVIPALRSAIAGSKDEIKAFVSGFTTVIEVSGDVIDFLGTMIGYLGDLIGYIEPLIGYIYEFEELTSPFRNVSEGAKQAEASTASFAKVLGGLVAGGLLYKATSGVGSLIGKMTGFSSAAEDVVGGTDTVSDSVEEMSGSVSSSTTSFTDTLKSGLDSIKRLISGVSGVINELIRLVTSGIETAARGLGESIVALLKPMRALANPQVAAGIGVFTVAALGLSGALYGVSRAAENFAEAAMEMLPVIKVLSSAVLDGLKVAFDSVVEVVDIVLGHFTEIAKSAPGLYAAARGIAALSGSLAAFGAGGVLAGIGSFFGGSAIEKIIRLGEQGESLNKISSSLKEISGVQNKISLVASAVETLASSLLTLEGVDISSVVSQLQGLNETEIQAAVNAASTVSVDNQTEQNSVSPSTAQNQPSQVNVQPAQQNVATVNQPTTTQPQETAETSVDVDDAGIKEILTQIRNGQRQLINSLQNGNVAVYLDGRKVNKELLRTTGISGK